VRRGKGDRAGKGREVRTAEISTVTSGARSGIEMRTSSDPVGRLIGLVIDRVEHILKNGLEYIFGRGGLRKGRNHPLNVLGMPVGASSGWNEQGPPAM